MEGGCSLDGEAERLVICSCNAERNFLRRGSTENSTLLGVGRQGETRFGLIVLYPRLCKIRGKRPTPNSRNQQIPIEAQLVGYTIVMSCDGEKKEFCDDLEYWSRQCSD